ncbi:dipeptidase [Kangiella shandongensis]|uniref:dipeptidase n=1 Tax=Kangiella shandongensis TaxID=2763258 RepID=UPI001CBDDD4E|nr:dipeptidase [Kangiella shandongensis]
MKKTFITTLVAATTLGLTACGSMPMMGDDAPEPDYAKQAQEISKKYIIADLHVDVPHRLHDSNEDISVATEDGDFDYPRAVAGGLDAPFMSIYIPADLEFEAKGESYKLANKLIDDVEAIVEASPDKFALATSPEEVQANFEKGLISLPMGMENGSPIEGTLANVRHFYDRGIRYITLAHSRSNHLSDSSYDEARPNGGLSEIGRLVVEEMNRLGMMVDVSHLSDEAFYDVLEVSKAPVIASHSSVRDFTPGFERNMDDDMIEAMSEKGGVIFINFGSTFVSQDSRDNYDAYKEAVANYAESNGLDPESEQVQTFAKAYRKKNPFLFADIEIVLDHIEYVIDLVGVDHVGIGSDYDGVGDSLPTGLKDVSTYPNLIQGLLERGYTEQDVAKILSGNLMRIWSDVERLAAE